MNKDGVQKGAGVDPQLVEQVKMLHRMGQSQAQIARDKHMSVATVRRYLQRPDETPELEAERVEQAKNFIGKAWKAIDGLMNIVNIAIEKGDWKAKDAAVTAAILIDKISVLESKPREKGPSVPAITFNFTSSLPDTKAVSFIEGEIQSDDLRPGSGEDILGLPGGRQDGPDV